MSNGAYAGLRLAARAGEPDTDEPNAMTPEDEDEADAKDSKKGNKKDDDYMTEDEHNAALAKAQADAKAEGFAEANARSAAVMASEHYAGNEKLAANLLGKPALSADDIIGSLEAAGPRTAAPAADAGADADDDAARADMRSKLAAEQPDKTADASDPEASAEDTMLVDNMKSRFPEAK